MCSEANRGKKDGNTLKEREIAYYVFCEWKRKIGEGSEEEEERRWAKKFFGVHFANKRDEAEINGGII